jgi:hypothetical protein
MYAGPHPAGGPELGDLLKELVVHVPEEAQPRGEGVDVEAALQRLLDVAHAVGEGEGQLLRGGRAGFADVVAADADGVPLRHMLGAVLDRVDDELDTGAAADKRIRSERETP